MTSKLSTCTKTHVKYLEYLYIKNTIEINRFDIDNQTSPAKPYVTESMEADLLDNYETIKILLADLGFPIFEEIRKTAIKKKEILYCKGKDACAECDLIDEGFVVFKGSKANREETKTGGAWVSGIRKKLIDSGILIPDKNMFIFTEDYVFGSPSSAAAAVLGRRANGWIEWKNPAGVNIDKCFLCPRCKLITMSCSQY